MEIQVVPYDPSWPSRYRREAALLREALGDCLVEIHHIGSTSVPGLWAKPIIDILPVVTAVEEADRRRAALEALGYEYLGEFAAGCSTLGSGGRPSGGSWRTARRMEHASGTVKQSPYPSSIRAALS